MQQPRTVKDLRKNNKYPDPENKTDQKNTSWNVDLNVKPKKNSFTQVRIQDEYIDKFKRYCLDNNLESYSGLINNILNKFIENNNL